MTAIHGKDTAIHAAQYDLSQYLNASDVDQTIAAAKTTTYLKESETYIPGLGDGTLSLGGIWDSTADDALATMVQSASGEPWAVAYDGFAVGNKARICQARQTAYKASAPVGDVVTYVVTVQADGGLDIATALHDSIAAETAASTSDGTDHGALTSDGGIAQIHVLAFTGTSIVVKVQHSTTDGSYVDLAEFAAASDATSERIEVSGTVNKWMRTEWTGTFSSATFAVVFARR